MKLNSTKYKKSKIGLVTTIYGAQISNSKLRNHEPPSYTKDDLKDWLFSQPKFHLLYDNWKRLSYQTDYKPSVDRLIDDIGYTMSNIQLMTFKENKDKAYNDIKSGTTISVHKQVRMFTEDGFTDFPSAKEASRVTGIHSKNISSVCRGIRNKAGGYRWEFTDGH
ncbi:MAG: hypothetical protein DRH03_11495 [Deltaproteobacteria bacterium]|nr:MAG: hypothetical protein DRH03_11495 [Deltaproteobacteria bacterium]